MAFTFKKYVAAQKKRSQVKQRPAGFQAPPTVPAGPKNSNGPKGGSSKSSVPANRTYLKTGKTKAPAPKVTKAKLDTTNKTPFNRSSRVNYRQLRRGK